MKLNTSKLNPFPNRMAVSAAALLALTAFSSVAADYPTTVQSYHPVGYWRLNETTPVPVGDIATNSGSIAPAGTGRYVEGVVHPVAGIPGAGGNMAMHLTNANTVLTGFSRLRIPWQAALNPNGPFTVEFWARPDYPGLIGCPSSSLDMILSWRLGWLFYQMDPTGANGYGWQFRVYNTIGQVQTASVGDPALDSSKWYHIVGVYNGTQIILYTNAVEAARTTISGTYAPNTSPGIPLDFGARSDGRSGNYGWGGDMDEGAIYNKVLTPDRILAHYNAGSVTGSGYAAVVQADAPVGWWRMDEPAYTEPDISTLPLSENSGTLGAAAHGTNFPGVTRGVAGPPCMGMGVNNYAVDLDGGNGVIDCGNSTGFDAVTNNGVTMAAWVKIRGWKHMYETVFSKGQAQRLTKWNTDGTPVYNKMDFTAGAELVGSRTVFDGLWHHIVGTWDATSKLQALYIDGTLDNSQTVAAIGTTTDNLRIGDIMQGGATWWIPAGGSGAGYMRPLFDGLIDEVAYFTNALTAAQVLDLFNSAQEVPVITLQPQPPTGNVYEGMSVTFTTAAIGAGSLSYQWTKNGNPLSGKTTTACTLSALTTGSSGSYAVVITNAYGATTSSVVTLTVQTSPPIIFTQPKSMTRFADGSATFTVVMGGSTPLYYQWTNSGGTIAGATKSSYTINNLRTSDAGPYGCRIQNAYGVTNSAVATLTVLPTAPYSAVIMAGKPLIYWRLNATNNNMAYDYANGYDGTIGGTMALQAGLASPAFPGFESGNQSYTFNSTLKGVVNGPALDLNRSAMAVSAWIVASNLSAGYYNGIVTKGDSSWRLHQQFQSSGVQWGMDGTGATAVNAPIASDDGAWHHVVATYDRKASQLYVDGALISSAAGTGLIATNGYVIQVGDNAQWPDRYWNGKICEVSLYNRPLSSMEVSNLYLTATLGPTMPIIVQQPVSQSVLVGDTVSFSADVYGGGPWTYTWKKNGVDMPGETNRTFDVRSAYYTDAGSYRVGVTNTAGGVLSDPATLTVVPQPLFANLTNSMVVHLKFDGNYDDSSGHNNGGTAQNAPILITPGKIGSGALHYFTDTSSSSFNCVSLGTPADLQFGSGQDFSVAFWTRFTGLPGNLPFLANNQNSYGDPGVTLAPSSQQGGWSWYINDASASAGQGIGLLDPVGATLNDGQWHSLVYTFDRSGLATVYLDGAVANQTLIAAGEGWNLDTGYTWNIGQAGGYYSVDGQFDMDDLGIWRRALSQAEAQSIYIVGQNYGRSFDTYGPVRLSINTLGTNIDVIWQAGTLLQSTNVNRNYTPVPGATAPFYRTSPTKSATFFRVQQ